MRHNKKHYEITPTMFKMMVMSANTTQGKKVRRYYIKLEEVFWRYATYQSEFKVAESALQLRMTEEKNAIELAARMDKLRISEKKNAVAEARLVKMNMVNKKLVALKQAKSRDEEVYIISSFTYASQGLFKVGHGKRSMTRLRQFNTGCVAKDQRRILHIIKCHDGKQLEGRIHNLLSQFRDSSEREFFYIPFTPLQEICDRVARGYEDDIEWLNDTIQMVSAQLIDGSIDYAAGIAANTFDSSRTIEFQITDEHIVQIIEMLVSRQLGQSDFKLTDIDTKEKWMAFKKMLSAAGQSTTKIEINKDQFIDAASEIVGAISQRKLMTTARRWLKIAAPYGIKKRVC